MLPKVLSSPASQTSSWSDIQYLTGLSQARRVPFHARLCRGRVPANCSGVGSHAPVVFQMFAMALSWPVPAIRPTSQNRWPRMPDVAISRPGTEVFVASRCHILLKAGFGHGSSPIADCVNAASFNGRTSACQADHAGSSLPVTTAAHPQRAPPPRAPAAHPAPAQLAPGSCPAAHPSGACRSAACCQHSCAASPAGLPACTANAGPPRARGHGPDRLPPARAANLGRARWGGQGRVHRYPRCRGRGRGHPRRGPGDRTPSGRRRRSRPKLHGGGATGPRAARGWHGA